MKFAKYNNSTHPRVKTKEKKEEKEKEK